MKCCMYFFIFLLIACNEPKPNGIEAKKEIIDTLSLSDNVYICFDSSFSGKKGIRLYKLGDSTNKIQQLLDITPYYPRQDTIYGLKNPIIKKSKLGSTTTTIFGYFSNKILYKFMVVWDFKGSFIQEARSEFYSVVLKSTMGCLWEESINIYASSDTLRSYYNNRAVTEYISKFTDSSWQIKLSVMHY